MSVRNGCGHITVKRMFAKEGCDRIWVGGVCLRERGSGHSPS